MKLLTVFVFAFVITTVKASNYEVIFDRLETAFGEDDEVFRFESLRVRKFNRTA